VFVSPTDPELYVTLADLLSGFPDRLADNESIAQQVSAILNTARFAR
jgi:hypothetical protein